MFAAITPALITGAFAERKRFGAFVLFTDPLVDPRLLADRPLGLVGRRVAVQGSARSTSPAAPSSTSARACRPSIVAILIGRRIDQRREP